MRKPALLLLLFCFGCVSSKKNDVVQISLVNNNRSVKFEGIDAAILGEIQRDSVPGIWQTLLPVYRMPADTDMKDVQQPQPGTYSLEDKAVVFKPDTPFIKGQTYYMRYYRFGEGKSIWDIVKNKRQLGSQPYTDFSWRVGG